MKNMLISCAVLGTIAITSITLTRGGVYIPEPEHRDLHSVVIFKGGKDAGAIIKLDIQALQDGDFIQYIAAIITDCDDEKNDYSDPPGKPKPPACPQVGEEVNFMFTQNPQNRQIKQLVDLDLTGTVFQANILKRQ